MYAWCVQVCSQCVHAVVDKGRGENYEDRVPETSSKMGTGQGQVRRHVHKM